jgi:peptidoglycan-N-acetylglucosamine deacetylase
MMGHDYLPYQVRLGDKVALQDPLVFGKDTHAVASADHVRMESEGHDAPILAVPHVKEVVDPISFDSPRFLHTREDSAVGNGFEVGEVVEAPAHGHFDEARMLERLLERLLKDEARFVTLSQALAEYRSRFPKGRSLRP